MMTAIFTDPSKYKHVAIVLDVTDRKRTQEALQQSEHELRLINESIPQIVWAAFPDASLDHYNQNWERYTGLSPSQHCSSMWRAVLHPDDYDRTVAAWNEAQKSERFEVEHRMRRHDGVYRWFLSRARPLRDENGNIARWYGTSTDIEDQKRTQWALERERDLREQFVNTLSHDLRNPLSAAKASAQIIARYPDRTDRIPSLATRITDSIGRADKMIEDLLDANRIRAGKGIPLEIKQCDLSEIAEKVCEELATVHGDRFVRDFSPSLEGYWSCKDLYRLLENLITNALKYGSSTTPVTVHLEERGKNVEIAIHNWGEPISPEDQKRLFDPFMRSKAAESGEKKGWGLGLTLVRGVTDAHGGRVEVESHRGSGTTFREILPRDARSDRATRD
jgi:PAS domain S-box-containing protein